MISFDASVDEIYARLTPELAEALDFGVVGFDAELTCRVYNTHESELAGLSKARVLGRHFFEEVAPCMNNFMVSQRFMDEPALDAQIDYVLTLRMSPKRVKLRLVRQPEQPMRYLFVRRAG